MQKQNLRTLDEKFEYFENYLLRCYGNSEENINTLKHKFYHLKSDII